MGPTEFALAVREERDALFASYADPAGETAVAAHLAAANLSPAQRKTVLTAIDVAVTDALYTLLLALDGAASLGTQQSLMLCDELGAIVANSDGRLQAAAWETFHGNGR